MPAKPKPPQTDFTMVTSTVRNTEVEDRDPDIVGFKEALRARMINERDALAKEIATLQNKIAGLELAIELIDEVAPHSG